MHGLSCGIHTTRESNMHCIGATYGLNETSTEERKADHETNIQQLLSNVPSLDSAIGLRALQGKQQSAALRLITARCRPRSQ